MSAEYYDYIHPLFGSSLETTPITPFTVKKGDSKAIAWVFQLPKSDHSSQVGEAVKAEIKCTECSRRAKAFSLLILKDDKGDFVNVFSASRAKRNVLTDLVRTPDLKQIDPKYLEVVMLNDRDSIFSLPFSQGRTPDGSGFRHWTVPHQFVCKNIDRRLYKQAFNKYKSLILALFCQLSSPELPDAIGNVLNLLNKVPYGKKFMAAATWVRDFVPMNFNESSPLGQAEIVSTALFSAPIFNCGSTKNPHPCFPWYHQISGNLTDLMALVDSPDQFLALATARLAPENYRLVTARPSQDQLNKADQELGDFDCYTIGIDELGDFGGKELDFSQDDDPAASSSSASSSVEPKTVADLFELGRGFWIQTSPHGVCYALGSTINPVHLVPNNVVTGPEGPLPLFWVFLNSHGGDEFKLNLGRWLKVTGMLPLGRQPDGSGRPESLLFVIEGSRIPNFQDRGLFSSCLKNKSLEKAFTSKNKGLISLMTIRPACGVGVSAIDNQGLLNDPYEISFEDPRSNSNPITITHLWTV